MIFSAFGYVFNPAAGTDMHWFCSVVVITLVFETIEVPETPVRTRAGPSLFFFFMFCSFTILIVISF
jgi:hypothetical protein